jgi:hypothetical protein
MVQLCTDSWQYSILEWLLLRNDIKYEFCLPAPECGITPPYLIVDGVPLDMDRSIKWIFEERCNEGKEV